MNAARAPLTHSPHPFFMDRGHDLMVCGESVLGICADLGSSPFYLYSRASMAQRLAALRAAVPEEVEIHYALKANPMPEVVRYFAEAADGMDVASVGEMRLALDSGMAPAAISFAGPGKSRDDLARAVTAGVVVAVESPSELNRLAQTAGELGRTALVCLRLNPEFELKGSGMKMGGGAKPFGVDADAAPELLARLGRPPLELVGLHVFSGSQSLSSDAIIDAQNRSVQLAIELSRHSERPLRLLNLGGGFGIPYFPGDRPLDVGAIGANLRRLLKLVGEKLPRCKVCIELGRYLVGEAGIYVCSVIDKKISRGRTFLVTDGGLNHHLAVTGNFGQLIRRNYPVRLLTRTVGRPREVVTVVGRLCTPLDVLADEVSLPAAEEGDRIAILQSGAYGLTASPLRFLSHPVASEILR